MSLSDGPDGLSPKPKKSRLVLDTITTRFLMLFSLFLMIPLCGVILFSSSFLDEQVDISLGNRLTEATQALQNTLERPGPLSTKGLASCGSLQDVTAVCRDTLKQLAISSADLPGLEGNKGPSILTFQDRLVMLSPLPGADHSEEVLLTPLNEVWFQAFFQRHPHLQQMIEFYVLDAASQVVYPISMRGKTIPPGVFPASIGLAANGRDWQEAALEGRKLGFKSITLYGIHHEPAARIVVALPRDFYYHRLQSFRWGLYWISVSSVLFAVLLAMAFSRNITQPVLKLIEQVDRLSRTGDLSQKVRVEGVYEIQTLTESFNRMLERLAQEQQRRDEFVATLTHDLKVPILAEKQSLAFLEQGTYGPLSEVQEEVIHLLKTSNQSVLQLVNCILDITRYDTGQVQLSIQPVDMEQLLSETLKELTPLAQEKSIEITVKHEVPPPEKAIVYGDALELKRLLQNLLGNAIANTPELGKIHCHIANPTGYQVDYLQRVSPYQHANLAAPLRFEGRTLLSIENTGMGFMLQDLPNLFKRFAVNKGRNPMSTGLGLYNCYQIVLAHHGSIWVETSEGEGAAVNILLPHRPEMVGERRKQAGRRISDREYPGSHC